ncbi:MAG: 3-dehydroquinate synthase, partial [Verrucomicrobiota bacterium]
MIERTLHVAWEHRVLFTDHVFQPANLTLRENLNRDRSHSPRRALLVLDEALAGQQPDLSAAIATYFQAHSD